MQMLVIVKLKVFILKEFILAFTILRLYISKLEILHLKIVIFIIQLRNLANNLYKIKIINKINIQDVYKPLFMFISNFEKGFIVAFYPLNLFEDLINFFFIF